MRLHAAVVGDASWARAPAAADGDDPDGEDRDAVEEALGALKTGSDHYRWLAGAAAGLDAKGKKRPDVVRIEAFRLPGEDGNDPIEAGYLALVGRFRVEDARGIRVTTADVTTEGDDGSRTGVEITLRAHLRGVAWWAKKFADGCGLPDVVARSVEVAAAWHDAGKVDARFQRMLCGGSDARAATEPLAKSKIPLADRAAWERAGQRSGYPKGARHELASVALLQAQTALLGSEVDADLVLHLVASHHGWCRPFAPVVHDPQPVTLRFEGGGTPVEASSEHGLERLDSGIAERFFRLVERYGWFGLSWLEAILRLADHRRSEAEQRGAIGPEEEA